MAEIVIMPKLGFDMAEGTLVRWVILEGEPISKGAILAEIETDKATVEVESAYEGILSKHLVPVGEIVPVNTPIAVVIGEGEEVDLQALLGEVGEMETHVEAEAADMVIKPAVATVETDAAEGDGHLPEGVKASPLARRMARDLGINLKSVTGTGAGGRIVKRDIESYVTAPAVGAGTTALEAEAKPVTPLAPVVLEPAPEDQLVVLPKLRAIIGRRMTEVKQQVPHFYVTHEYDMAGVMELRTQINGLLPEGEKISVNDFLLKGVALALRRYPNLNAAFQGDHILHHGRVNVGAAVTVEGGLLTVVCQDTDQKSLRQISAEVRTMVGRARGGKVRPGDIEGSTFSVSNLGMFDVEEFIAIINPPEAAILAVGAVKEVPVVQDGEIVPGMRMKATISVDHRVSDGAEAARFLQALAEYFEEPLRLML